MPLKIDWKSFRVPKTNRNFTSLILYVNDDDDDDDNDNKIHMGNPNP